ncbi:hypothetical protein Igni_1429 [Ignicoccus hospitalis KIN4/I]|uniref:HEPN domain-containing protein n=1 Tax=Ignicoccus hospitalis (strain KIN4/I / DSM 18386 / JCM 14125) TaxID=453591 RepID=A8ACF3_IGNH4|nr:hypothetical protein Igni_1429 [Ignicoccus hospitalis KIN4/I]
MDPWIKAAEDFLWTAEILMTMGRYAQAFMLACHALNLCKRGKAPFERAPKECVELIFPRGDLTPEDLVTQELAERIIKETKECLGL